MSTHKLEYSRGYQAGYKAGFRRSKVKDWSPPPPLPLKPSPNWRHELAYMIGRGWLFSGTLVDEKWKLDPDAVKWLENGWIEMDPSLGFRITPAGEKIAREEP